MIAPFIPPLGRWAAPGAVAALISAWTLVPLDKHRSLIAIAVLITLGVIAYTASNRQAVEVGVTEANVLRFGFCLLLCALLSALMVDAHSVARTVSRVANSDRALVFFVGTLAALFPAGALIGALTHRWAVAIEARLLLENQLLVRGLEGAGRYIGWLERLIVFAAIALNHPEAVAVVLTAKSIARFPSFRDEGFAEYFLIGSLLSGILGVAAAISSRVLLGLAPL